MKIPLAITPADDKLIIYRNGERESVPLPFKPFAMIQKDQFPYSQGPVEKWRKVPEDEEREYVRLSFNSIQELNKFKGQVRDKSKYVLINSYVEQLFISKEDFLLKYPHTNELTVMFFDIEVATKGDGFFPRPVSNPILCIGYSIWKYRPDGTKYKVHHEICKGFSVENEDDSDVIDKFFQGIEKWDPDLIAGYYSSTFDIPYIIERAEICRVDTARMSRGGKKPVIRDSDIYIPGRIQFDIYASNAGVFKDQTLFGIKSRSLKEIARWYKAKRTTKDDAGSWKTEDMQDIELPGEIENLVKLLKDNPERLYAYQDDDVYRTEWVGHVYIRNCITLAEMLKVPLNNIINMYSSFVPKLFVGRNMERIGLINTESNFSRYNPANGSIEAIGTKFQAAISELFRSGFVPATWKLDFLSQYPSIIMTFGLGIDTTKLVRLEKYTGKYGCKEEENHIWYRLPSSFDKGKYWYDLIVRVKKGGGFLGKEIKKLMEERKKIKASMKKASEEEYDALNSQQTAIKIIMNSIFGLMGLKSTVYGDMITATMITGLARWCLTRSMQHVREHVVNCDSVTNDTPIYVRDKDNKEIDIIPIEDLHNSNELRQLYKGNYEVLTRNGWKEIKYIKKHRVSKKIYRTKISDGYVDATEDHSLFTINKKEISPTEINHKTQIETTNDPIKTKDFIYGDSTEDEEFCWLIGFFIAEGSAYEGKNKKGEQKRQISFNGNDIKLMKKVEKLANEHLCGLAIDIRELKKPHKFKLNNTIKSSAVYKVQGGYNKLIVDWFKKFCYTSNRKDKKVPRFIINGSREMKQAFIDGLMCEDGYINKSQSGQKNYELNSKFKSLSAGFRFLLNSLEEKTSCSIRKDKENITVYRKRVRYSSGKYRNIDKNIVTKNYIISEKGTKYVYDISTEDGTFVTALGNIVLHNTDGFVVDCEIDADKETKWLDGELKKKFFVKNNKMILELEGDAERGYFYRPKNYIIETVRDGKVQYTIHGSSLKASKAAKVVDRAVSLGIDWVFNDKPPEEVIREAYNFKDLSIDNFIERVNLSKEPKDYDDNQDWRVYLAEQVKVKTGQVISKGDQISYVVTKEELPYKAFDRFKRSGRNYTYIGYVESPDELDLSYYKNMVEKALEKFGISKEKIIVTDLFDGTRCEKKPIIQGKLSEVPQEDM